MHIYNIYTYTYGWERGSVKGNVLHVNIYMYTYVYIIY